jgi:hypothetical protein
MCASQAEAEQALTFVRRQLAVLRLELNAEKTRLIHYDEGLEFLGQALVPPRPAGRMTVGLTSFAEAEQVVRNTSTQVWQRLTKKR